MRKGWKKIKKGKYEHKKGVVVLDYDKLWWVYMLNYMNMPQCHSTMKKAMISVEKNG